MNITRKQFLSMGALAGATVTLLVTGCGSDDDGGGSGGSSGSGGGSGGSGGGSSGSSGAGGGSSSACAVDMTNDHGHALVIAAADLDSTAPKTYDIQGSADHPHSVTLTAPNFAQLKSGDTVSVDSTVNGAHGHSLTISCV